MNGNSSIEVQLGPDFATRVLAAADRRLTRRRLHRQLGAALVLFVGITATAIWLNFGAGLKQQEQNRTPELASASESRIAQGPGDGAVRSTGSPDALSWLFPDAEPLVRYAAEDANDDSGGSAGALFTDEE